MKTIWKFALEVVDRQCVAMPKGAEVLCVQAQYDTPCLWALVDSDAAEKTSRCFRVYGTGHSIPDGDGPLSYVGTFQLPGLVFHVFEEERTP